MDSIKQATGRELQSLASAILHDGIKPKLAGMLHEIVEHDPESEEIAERAIVSEKMAVETPATPIADVQLPANASDGLLSGEAPRGPRRPRDDDEEDWPEPKRFGPSVTTGSNSFNVRGGVRGSNNNFGGVNVNSSVAAKKASGNEIGLLVSKATLEPMMSSMIDALVRNTDDTVIARQSDDTGTSQMALSSPRENQSTFAASGLPKIGPNEASAIRQKRRREDEDSLPELKRAETSITIGANSFNFGGGVKGSKINIGGVNITINVIAKKRNGKKVPSRNNRIGRQ